MSLIRSGSTLVPLLPSGSRYWPAPGSPSGICFSGGGGRRPGRPRQGRPAVDELLADQRLRPDLAAGVAAEVLEARVGDLHHDHRLAGRRDRLAVAVGDRLARHRHADRLDRADVGAGDPDLLAVDHEAAVVEDRADDVAVAGAPPPETSRTTTTTAATSTCRDYQPPDHGPGGASAGLHSEGLTRCRCGGSTKGLEPSGAGWVAPPGQRRRDVGRAAEGVELFASGDRFQRRRLRRRRGSAATVAART